MSPEHLPGKGMAALEAAPSLLLGGRVVRGPAGPSDRPPYGSLSPAPGGISHSSLSWVRPAQWDHPLINMSSINSSKKLSHLAFQTLPACELPKGGSYESVDLDQ